VALAVPLTIHVAVEAGATVVTMRTVSIWIVRAVKVSEGALLVRIADVAVVLIAWVAVWAAAGGFVCGIVGVGTTVVWFTRVVRGMARTRTVVRHGVEGQEVLYAAVWMGRESWLGLEVRGIVCWIWKACINKQ
jgi:hypothetical protein